MSGGPKCYRYITRKGKTNVKIKGYTLNTGTLGKLNHETLKSKILQTFCNADDDMKKIVVDIPDHFTKSQEKKEVRLTSTQKEFDIKFDKRVVQPDLTTPSYGY